jgi:hypothetical protein
MKIYIGNNKKTAKEITLKQLIGLSLKSYYAGKETTVKLDRFGDNSGSWINVRKKAKDEKSVLDILLNFDPKTDNTLDGIEIWESKYIIDEEHPKKLV